MFIPTPLSGWNRRSSISPATFQPTMMMTTTRMTTEHLVTELDSVGAVPLAWRKAFLAVLRYLFIPSQIWVDDEHGNPQPLS